MTPWHILPPSVNESGHLISHSCILHFNVHTIVYANMAPCDIYKVYTVKEKLNVNNDLECEVKF